MSIMIAMLTTRQVAALLGMTTQGVRRLIIEGYMPKSRKIGRDYLIDPNDLELVSKPYRMGRPRGSKNLV